MKSILLASVSVAALFIASEVSAADLPVKARPLAVAPAPVYSWTGCYVGAQAGWGWGRNRHSQTNTAVFSSFPNTTTAAAGRVDSNGGLLGGQVGCNYQFASNWVVGLQGDIAGTDFRGSGPDPIGPALGAPAGNTIAIKTDWLASVTGRLGYAAYNNQALFYAKGGAAWVHNKWDLFNTFNTFSPTSIDETRTGWTVGGGVEWKFTQNWSVFGEFNYYNFGNGKLLQSNDINNPVTFSSGKQEIETVKIGVNYSFSQGPVVAKY